MTCFLLRSIWISAVALLLSVVAAAHPLASRVLVVYTSGDANSIAVANYYQAARGIPNANMCAVPAPGNNPASGYRMLEETDWVTYFKTPIQACLTTVGPANILYIVLAYVNNYQIHYSEGNPVGPYALDSFIADIWDQTETDANAWAAYQHGVVQGYYTANNVSTGNYPPVQTMVQYRAANPTSLIYAVFRLDGATPAIAEAQVSNAIATENAGGVQGQACLDARSTTTTPGSMDGALYQASVFARQASLTVTLDQNDAQFGTAPAQLTCLNAALYSGWYALAQYNDAFGLWPMGAVGWHIDSGSMMDPRSGLSAPWGPAAIARGITATSGSVAEPLTTGLVQPDGAFHDLLYGANLGDAFLRNTRFLKFVIINVGDPLYQPYIARVIPARSAVVRGGGKLRGSVKLRGPTQ